MLHSICQQIWKTQQWPQDWKRSVFILIPKKGNAKECSNDCTIALITMDRASRGDGIPAELFQILKDDAVKVLHSICQQIWKTHGIWSHHFMANRWENNGNSDRLIFLGGGPPKSLQMVTAATKLKDTYSLEGK